MIDIQEDNLKQGVLGLVMALVEIIRDALKTQVIRRVEGDTLTHEETERLGRALIELDEVIDQIKQEMGLTQAVKSVRDGLDDLVDDMVRTLADPDPRQWAESERHRLRDDSRVTPVVRS